MRVRLAAIRNFILPDDEGNGYEFQNGAVYNATILEACVHIYPARDVLVRVNSDFILPGNDNFMQVRRRQPYFGPNGPTGHGDICMSDADCGL